MDSIFSSMTKHNAMRMLKHSLRVRLLLGTLLGIMVVLVMTGFVLTHFFMRYATQQLQTSMLIHLNQLSASFEVNHLGQPVLLSPMSDPKFSQPLSGMYWQVNSKNQPGIARSRSLWDSVLALPRDSDVGPHAERANTGLTQRIDNVVNNDANLHVYQALGPNGAPALILERNIRLPEHPDEVWQLMIASNTNELEHSIQEWTERLIFFLSLLFVTLAIVAVGQVLISLAPLRTLQNALGKLPRNRLSRLEGNFPQEVQPLIDDFNKVLDHSTQVVVRARAQTGDLAHALNTPLAVLSIAATRSLTLHNHESALAQLVQEQVSVMQRHIDWRLRRARTGATAGMPSNSCPVQDSIEQIVRVMEHIHAAQQLKFSTQCTPENLVFWGELQDFQEILGNLLDNAAKWAAARVEVRATQHKDQLTVTIDDDGPGLSAEQYTEVLQRGVRMDEQVPGTGLGLAIVKELVDLYEGTLTLSHSPLGGLRVAIRFNAMR